MCRHQTYPPLQAIPLLQRQCVGLGNDWDYVDFAVDGLHKLHIQRLQTSKEKDYKEDNKTIRTQWETEDSRHRGGDSFEGEERNQR